MGADGIGMSYHMGVGEMTRVRILERLLEFVGEGVRG